MPPKSKNKGSPVPVPETQATPGTNSLQATEGQGHADPKMMSDDQKSTIKRLIEQSQERLDPECLTYPDGIEPPANFSEQVKNLIKMIEEDDEAEVTEADAAQLIDEIKAEIISRNEIHADFRNRRIKSVMQELSDAQHAIAEARLAEQSPANEAESHIGKDGDVFFDIVNPSKSSDKAKVLALSRENSDNPEALHEALKTFVKASEGGALTREHRHEVFTQAATGVGITIAAAGDEDNALACRQGHIPLHGDKSNSTRRAAAAIRGQSLNGMGPSAQSSMNLPVRNPEQVQSLVEVQTAMLRKGEGRDCPKSTFDTVKLERSYKLPGEMELWSLKRLVVQSRVAHGVIAVLADHIATGDKHAAMYEVLLKKLEREIKNPTTAVAIDALNIGPEELILTQFEAGINMGGNALAELHNMHKRLHEQDFTCAISLAGKIIGDYTTRKQNSPEQDLVRIQEVMQHAENTLDPIRLDILKKAGIDIKSLARPETIMSMIILEHLPKLKTQPVSVRDTITPELLEKAKNMTVNQRDFSQFKTALDAAGFDASTAFPEGTPDQQDVAFFMGNPGKGKGKGKGRGKGPSQPSRGRDSESGGGGNRPRSRSRSRDPGEPTAADYYEKGVDFLEKDFANFRALAELISTYFVDMKKPEPFARNKKDIKIPLQLNQGYAWKVQEVTPQGTPKPHNHGVRIDMYAAWSLVRDLNAGEKYLSKVGARYQADKNGNWKKISRAQFNAKYKPAKIDKFFPDTMTSILGEQKTMFKFK